LVESVVADVDKTEHLARMTNGARGLRQDDLSSIVPQSNLSAILAGKRKISATLAEKFDKFFGVNPSIFVPR
jgi:HTH-type transcriptional regulator/antitoxin HigA